MPASSNRARSRWWLAAPIVCVAGAALAQSQGFTIADIQVEGLERTEPGSVFAVLPFRVGDTYTEAKGAAALRAIFATGQFRDVRIRAQGSTVIVTVAERDLIASVKFKGIKEFDSEALTKSLHDAGIGEGQPFDRGVADRAEQEIKREYLARSLYGAEVTTTTTPAAVGKVDVVFTVSEGDRARIKSIRIVGNHAFSESTLVGQMDLSVGGWLTWYTKSDQYSRAKLNADLETLRTYYQRRGYLEFDVTGTQVAVSPDKQSISVTINVHEGPRYYVTGVKLTGDWLGREDEFAALVQVQPGKPYDSQDVENTTKAMQDRFGNFGYAFAKVELQPEMDRDKGRVLVVMHAVPQVRAYVRRINIKGNLRTRDEVIRREFRQFESAWYDSRRIKASRDRVDRLGFFNTVTVDTVEVPGTADQVDLDVTVDEKSNNSVTLGASYSSSEKLGVTAGLTMDNVLGSGNYLSFDVNTSKSARSVSLSSTDPYFTQDGISRTFDIYYRTNRPLNSQGEDYTLVTPGLGLRFGVPFSETDTIYFGGGWESTTIKGSASLPNAYLKWRDLYGDTASSVPLTIGWGRDDRDSAIAPTRGGLMRLNTELGVLGDTRYAKTGAQFQRYWALTKKYTLGLNLDTGWGRGLEGHPFPIYKNYYGGGLGSVRGFDQGSLGVTDLTGGFLGGTKKIVLNSEFYVPFPGAGNDKSLRLFGYFDAGNVWGATQPIRAGDVRASAGLGMSWVSPVGPLKLSWGVPVRDKPEDRIQRFQFQIGTAF